MKKIVSLILAMSMLAPFSAAAAYQPTDKAVFEVTALNIMQGDENGNLNLDQQLTRAEFAAVILNMLGYKDAAMGNAKTKFTDVPEDAWFSGRVDFITQLGIMNGTSDTEFSPNEAVTFNQAVKTLVVALGYGISANEQGGYPNGHLAQGERLGLLKGISAGEEFVRGSLLQMVYNALDIDMMEYEYGTNSGSYVITPGNTIRNLLMNQINQSVYSGKAILNATADLWTDVPVSGLKDDEVRIGNYIYKKGNTNADAYLGQEVEFYAEESADDKYVLRSVRPTSKNTKLVLDDDDITALDFDKITYYLDGNRRKTMNIDKTAMFIKNGEPIQTKDADKLELQNARVTAIDNNDDSRVDIIIIEDYITVEVQSVKDDTIYFSRNDVLNGSKYLKTDEGASVIFSIVDTDGNRKGISDIQSGDMLSIAAGENGTYYRIVICSDEISGKVTGIESDGLSVDGVFYKKDTTRTIEVNAGDSITAKLDYRGRIAKTDAISEQTLYGYIQKVFGADDDPDKAVIKMLIGKTVENTTEIDDEDADNEKEIPVLVAQNSGTKTYELTDKVRYAGSSVSADDLKKNANSSLAGKVVEYKVNKDGKINSIEPLEMYGGDSDQTIKFNSYDMVFGGITGVTPFAVDSQTQVICVPLNSNPSSEDCMVKIQLGSKDFPRENFKASGYEYDSDTKKAKLLVIYDNMFADSVNAVTEKNDIGMVVNSSLEADEDKNVFYRIDILEKGKDEPTSYRAAEIGTENSVIENLQKGDLIYYLIDGTGKLSNAKIIESFSREQVPMYDLTNGILCGNLLELETDEIDSGKNQLAALVKFQVNQREYSYYIPQRNVPPIFIYESASKQTEALTSMQEAQPGTDMIYMVIVAGEVKACVLVR